MITPADAKASEADLDDLQDLIHDERWGLVVMQALATAGRLVALIPLAREQVELEAVTVGLQACNTALALAYHRLNLPVPLRAV